MAEINVLEGKLYAVYDKYDEGDPYFVEALYWQSEDSSQNLYIVGSKFYSGSSERWIDSYLYEIPSESRVEVTNLMMNYEGNRENNISETLELNDILQIIDRASK